MTKQVSFNYKRATKRLLSFVAKCLQKGKSLQFISEGLRDICNSYIGLNRNERYLLYKEAYDVARSAKSSKEWQKKLALRKNFEKVLVACRKVRGSKNLREKKMALKDYLGRGDIFFLCSSHINPAKDHEDYQGKIYVDRFWRQKVPGSLYSSVRAYIKNHNTITIQDIMGAPVYLMTRPNCRHFWIPLKTKDVLSMSARKIREEFGVTTQGKLAVAEYYDIRDTVYKALNNISPNKYFKNNIR